MIKVEFFKEYSNEYNYMTWYLALLTKKYKGLFFSWSKFWKGVYIHFPEKTYRLYYSMGKFGKDSYCTKSFNKGRVLETLENESIW